ncbi:cytochrome c biogenesis protein ResB [Heliophilum fasciatum]|uniref:Ccs1 n=1 Tax=Heliophilum fasciatum TaxID=35700 RepID=A7UGU6_9FIRM|nr:cytochrome c biogenesis protein ResB [Heliophilum fasciatum]ABU41504.1 Ccs1 [Heliophilum fasciatum]MCW2278464.1 cytochrome c biogenesis protein [Heliophilum fasciatum]TCP63595.1 cytochrome c biogenesis protein [Heliophilum fasciatum]
MSNQTWTDRAWNFFSSMKLGLILLLVIAVAAIAGTVIPQNQPPQAYGSSYELYDALGLTDMYHTWWFLVLLALLSMNLLVCSVHRFGALQRQFSALPAAKKAEDLRSLATKATSVQPGSVDAVAATIATRWQQAGYRVQRQSDGETQLIAADKGRWGIWGSLITHLGMLVLLAGAVVSTYMSTEDQAPLEVGQQVALSELGGLLGAPSNVAIQVKDFKTIYREDGTIQDWLSTLTVLKDGQEQLTQTIEVNQPLYYEGYKFYQAFYGANMVTHVTGPNGESRDVRLEEGEAVQVPGTKLAVMLYRYVPDFDPAIAPQTKSNEPNNPRVIYVVYEGMKQIDVGAAQIGVPETLPGGATLGIVSHRPYTGLLIRQDPGVNIVWLGCAILLVGMGLSFYLPYRRIWAAIEPKGAQATIAWAGISPKNKVAFVDEFHRLTETKPDVAKENDDGLE